MTFVSLLITAIAPVIAVAAWLAFVVMREAARVHSFDRDFTGMHFE